MKKVFGVICLSLLLTQLIFAKVEFGLQIHGGLSLSRYKNYSLKNAKLSSLGGQFINKTGGGGGVGFRMWFNKYIGLSVDVEVNQGGNIRKMTTKTGGTQEFTQDERINYIVIPLLARVGWGNDVVKIYGTAGGYYGFAFSGKYHTKTVQNNIVLSDQSGKLDFDNTYTRTDAGVRFGAGVEVYVSKDRKHGITADFTYDWGLSKVLQQDIQFKNHTYRFTNSRTLIQIGYLIRFGKSKKNDNANLPKM